MDMTDFEHFHSMLTNREDSLNDWLSNVSSATDDELAKVRELVSDIRRALARIENRTYGICQVCKGDIELHRLETQPIAEICLDCISEEERETLQEELQIASKIHRALLPQQIETVDGFDIAVKALAARSIGGDYFDFIRSDSDREVRVVIADTMGKGIPAGLLMSNFQGALRVLAQEIESPSRLLSRLNHWLCRNIPVTKFVSMALVDVPIGFGPASTIHFANAGHCPGILMHPDGRWECLDPTGGVIGVHEAFHYDEDKRTLKTGDILVLYTDGAIEAENPDGTMFEQDRLVESITRLRNQNADTIVNSLLTDITTFTGSQALEDDFTTIVIRKL